MPADTRRENFDRAIADYDEKALGKCVDFTAHAFITIERDAYTEHRYVKGHRTLRAACDYLAGVRQAGEPFAPEQVIDLDSGTHHDLRVIAFVAPRSMDAVAVMLPRSLAEDVVERLVHGASSEHSQSLEPAIALFRKAIDRR